MARNTSILIGEYYENFINRQRLSKTIRRCLDIMKFFCTYHDFEKQKSYFKKYIEQIQNQKNGICAVCIDSKEVKNMVPTLKNQNNIVTYSVKNGSGANIIAKNIEFSNLGSKFDVEISGENKSIKDIFIPAYELIIP